MWGDYVYNVKNGHSLRKVQIKLRYLVVTDSELEQGVYSDEIGSSSILVKD